MAASSIGSDIFALTSLAFVSLLALLVIRHYVPLRTTPGYLLLPVFLALALPCSIILLVPIDLASAAGEDGPSKAIWLPERVALVTWRITYWLTFMLTWFILPLLGEYCDSGFRDTRGRVLYSLRRNARYQLTVLACAILGLVYFILQNGFHLQSIKGMVMALAYGWGLILVIGLMGHGMVALPRRLYINADVARRLKRLQAKAPKLKDKLDDAGEELDGLEHTVMQLKQRKHGTSRELQEWIDELADTSLSESRPGARNASAFANQGIPAVVTERYLAELTRKLKRARHKKVRFVHEWARLCQQAQDTQTILDAASSGKLDFGRSPPGLGRIKLLTPTARYYLHARGLPVLRIGAAAVLAVASVLLICSEFAKGFKKGELSIVGLTVVHNNKVNFGGQLIASLWLFYMSTCALYAISDVKVWGNRALVVRQTYAESATWYSLQVAKLTVPLSYNFITLLPQAVYQETMFYRFLGNLINLTPLGSGFSSFFPCFILLPVLASAFNLYGRAGKLFGFGDVLEDESNDDQSPFSSGGWREGRALIEQEWHSQNREGGSANLGLSTRGASLDLESGTRSSPVISGTSTPLSHQQNQQQSRQPLLSSVSVAPQASNVNDLATARRQFNSVTNQEEEEDDDSPRHFYHDFTERVRNTFETTDRPEWVKDIGNVFKTPKWMQNEGDSGSAGFGGAGSSNSSNNNPFKKWFGGDDDGNEGRLRL
ncbi:hypothetical protein K431DRAFT_289568 [Polychaeton citri CBS 116435]|uniref:Uncharacterized protein n=1 Tax=Polychaeton citri CBS 116435 TaxID=1314669 RepID=A0A9P4Q0J0_9PEZI|nr:hypothetical protein K431DRAFT_289568 [Polychaeton citri CBS 116435]